MPDLGAVVGAWGNPGSRSSSSPGLCLPLSATNFQLGCQNFCFDYVQHFRFAVKSLYFPLCYLNPHGTSTVL